MYHGIIFDMDNTLLRSDIDFAAMKRELYEYFVGQGVLREGLSLKNQTCATVIRLAQRERLTEEQERRMWSIAEEHELRGMEGAGLEYGARELLDDLEGRYTLALLTNNAQSAAEKALRDTGIAKSFTLIVGREKAQALKPASDGVELIVRAYPDIPRAAWLSVGDAWIDGRAAMEAGIDFVCYRGDRIRMEENGIRPRIFLERLEQLSAWLQEGGRG